MNRLSFIRRVQVLQLLVEGMSMRSVERVTGVHIDTITRLLVAAGKACLKFHNESVRNLKTKRIECDEMWAFCHSKKKNVPKGHKGVLGYGDAWLWQAIDADTKLIISWVMGHRTSEYAEMFIDDLASRLDGRVQLTTDGWVAYKDAIEQAFGKTVDYAMLVKLYDDHGNYEGSEKRRICGNPKRTWVTTSHIERLNLTIRMQNRRFTRDTNAFSKKFENMVHSVAIDVVYDNFVRIHSKLRVTPAMEAGLTKHLWEITDIVNLIPEPVIRKRGPYRKKNQKISN
jgi:IS1 family transposase